jgi:D-sedoheptulose 7-phosphate isomerase
MRSEIDAALTEAADAVARLRADDGALGAIETAAGVLVTAFRARRRVFSCGNGGSMCDAMHFAEELSGRFRGDRPPLAAVAISDPAHLTCTANDYGFEQVFARYVEAHGNPGDVLVAISTSGKSPNVLAAATRAKAHGLSVVALTGTAGSLLAAHADVEICTPVGRYSDRIQELHIKVLHILIELVERSLFPSSSSG